MDSPDSVQSVKHQGNFSQWKKQSWRNCALPELPKLIWIWRWWQLADAVEKRGQKGRNDSNALLQAVAAALKVDALAALGRPTLLCSQSGSGDHI